MASPLLLTLSTKYLFADAVADELWVSVFHYLSIYPLDTEGLQSGEDYESIGRSDLHLFLVEDIHIS